MAGIPEAQLKYVSSCSSGMGVLKHGEAIIPFDARVNKKNNLLYDLFNTNLHEKRAEKENKGIADFQSKTP